jgi:hypothetical protein
VHENGRTNEKMVVRVRIAQTPAGSVKQILISRHPYEASNQWIEQNEKKMFELDLERKKRNINVSLDYLNEVD